MDARVLITHRGSNPTDIPRAVRRAQRLGAIVRHEDIALHGVGRRIRLASSGSIGGGNFVARLGDLLESAPTGREERHIAAARRACLGLGIACEPGYIDRRAGLLQTDAEMCLRHPDMLSRIFDRAVPDELLRDIESLEEDVAAGFE